jgi:hypothetical protein
MVGLVLVLVSVFVMGRIALAAGTVTCTGRIIYGKSLLKETVGISFKPLAPAKDYSIKTDQGTYKITDLPAGKYNVVATWKNQKKEYNDILLIADKTKILHIDFTPPDVITWEFKDANLLKVVKKQLADTLGVNVEEIKEITKQNALKITNLYGTHKGIKDLSGLQYLSSLVQIDMGNNKIEVLSPIKDLTSLTSINLRENNLEDISDLKNLTCLTDLNLEGNSIEIIKDIQGLTKLNELNLMANPVNNISFLSGLTSLKKLYLSGTKIDDISALIANAENNGLGEGDMVHLPTQQIKWSQVEILLGKKVDVQPSSQNEYLPD